MKPIMIADYFFRKPKMVLIPIFVQFDDFTEIFIGQAGIMAENSNKVLAARIIVFYLSNF